MLFMGNTLRRYQGLTRQFVKFGITGTIGAVVDFGTYTFLTRWLGWDTIYIILGLEVIAANTVSVFLAILSNFILNKYWTFRDREEQVVQQGVSYFAFNTVTWVLNQILTSLFTFQVPLFTVLFGSKRDFVAKALAIALIMFINFLGSKLLIFRTSKTRVMRDTVEV